MMPEYIEETSTEQPEAAEEQPLRSLLQIVPEFKDYVQLLDYNFEHYRLLSSDYGDGVTQSVPGKVLWQPPERHAMNLDLSAGLEASIADELRSQIGQLLLTTIDNCHRLAEEMKQVADLGRSAT